MCNKILNAELKETNILLTKCHYLEDKASYKVVALTYP
jgi:hypothetical protein